jgi:hypothetical protein
MPLSVEEFAAKIKAKYPDYADMADDELAKRIVDKYPDYASQVSLEPAKPSLAQRVTTAVKQAARFEPPGLPEAFVDIAPKIGVEIEEPTLFGGGEPGRPSGATGEFPEPPLPPQAPARALPPEAERVYLPEKPALEVEHKATRFTLPNVPLAATVYGAAKSLPFVSSLIPQDADVEEVERTHSGSVALGYFGGMAGQTLAVGGALTAIPKVKQLQAAISLVQNPSVRKAAHMGLQMAIRATAGGVAAGAQQAQQVTQGKQALGQALLNTAETSLANAVSVLPEGLLPRNALQLVAQPAADALFNYLWDKGSGRTYRQEDVVNIGGVNVPKRYLWESLAAVGFATMDIETGQIKPKPKVQQQNFDALAEMLLPHDVPFTRMEVVSPEPTQFVFTEKGARVKESPGTLGAENIRRAEAGLEPIPTGIRGKGEIARAEKPPVPEHYAPDEEPTSLYLTPKQQQRVFGKVPSVEPRSNSADQPDMFRTGQQDGILEGESGSVKMPENAGKTLGAVKKFWKEWFTSNGMLPSKAAWLKVIRNGQINNYMRDIDRTVKQFDKAAKRSFGRRRLTDDQAFQVDAVLKGEQPTDVLPEPLQPVIKEMRSQIDALSQRMIDDGLVSGELAAVISDNLGYYATRSYRVFDEPNWARRVPLEVRNNAKAFLRNEITQRHTTTAENIEMRLDDLAGRKAELQAEQRIPRRPTEVGRVQTLDERIAAIDQRSNELYETLQRVQEQATPSEDQLNGLIDNLLYKEGAPVSVLASGTKLGSKNLSMLKRRKQIPAQIRALWGEYKNADINYAKSVSRMSNALANHQFLSDVLTAGRGDFFFDEPIVRGGESYSAKIAADESSAMAPLNGKYTTPEIKRAFEESVSREALPDWLRLYMKGVGTVKYAKTIGSFMTHVRNTTGNVSFAIANGHFRVQNVPDAFKATFADIVQKSPAELQGEIKELIGLGVLSDGARAGELKGIINDASQGNVDVLVGTGPRKRLQRGLELVTKAYGAEDDVWKFYAFRNEHARYKKALPDMPETELRQHVARIVRDTYPTYSMVPKAMQKLRRFPFVGTFISFPAEVIRTAKNTIGLTARELKDPRLKAVGAQRLAGLMTAAALPTALGVGSRYLTGTTDKKEEAMREFMPPWSQNSIIVHTGKGDDLHRSYIDFGYTDPHSYLRNPIIAFMRGENWESKVYESVAEMFEPFISEDIMTQKLLDLRRNRTQQGQPIYNERDRPENIAVDIGTHFAEALEPGTVSGLRRMYKGARGEEGKAGTPYDFKTEAIAQATGVRTTVMNVPRSLAFKGYKFNRDVRDVMRLARKRNVPVAAEQLTRVFDRMRKTVDAAYLLGMKEPEIIRVLLNAGLPKKAAGSLVKGTYSAYIQSVVARKTAALKAEEARKRTELE